MKTLMKTLIALGVLAFGTITNAAVLNYSLMESNTLDPVYVDDGTGNLMQIPWAVVTIRDSGMYDYGASSGGLQLLETTGDVAFVVDVNEAAFANDGGSQFGLQTFSFNYDIREFTESSTALGSIYTPTGNDLDMSNIIFKYITPNNWIITNNHGSVSEFGKFDFSFAGSGNFRTTLLSFLITGVEGNLADNYAVYFASHIAGFDNTTCDEDGGCTSGFFAGDGRTDRGLIPPVPVPPAVWLFGSGLIGLIAVGRRKV